MITKSVVKKNQYHDSVVLMNVSEKIRKVEGVLEAAAVMATDNNKRILRSAGMLTEDVSEATPNDLTITVRALSGEAAEEALSETEAFLTQREVDQEESPSKTLETALEKMPDANLALISVPGTYAAREAMKALDRGLNVFLFSSNVPIEDELELKRTAKRRGLFVMGPDCGTSIINRVSLGFANVVKPGPIGIVAASGTGIQEVSALLSELSGISQAIGTGGRDLSDRIGGLTMIGGVKALETDEKTKVIVLVSKPPSADVTEKILKQVDKISKPVVVCFLGARPIRGTKAVFAATLEDAAMKALALLRGEEPRDTVFTIDRREVERILRAETSRLAEDQKYVRGLFSGGTLCSEAMLVLNELIGGEHSNIPLKPELRLEDTDISVQHTCVDMGTEEFTTGRPHPMIDFSLRNRRIIQEAKDPETAVLLLDVILGYGAHPNPGETLGAAIREAKRVAEEKGRYLAVVASVCGTRDDPQNLTKQKMMLRGAGVVLMPSNAQAARMAALIATRGVAERKKKKM